MTRTLLALLLLAAFGAAAVLGVASSARATASAPDVDLAVAEVRWRALTPAERVEMRARYERFSRMNVVERDRMRTRANRIGLMLRRLYTGLEPEVRRRVDSLDPERRRALLREMVGQEALETSQRILRKLPPDVRTRVENATPEDRARYLRDFKRRVLRVDRGLERLGPDIGMSATDIERLKEMPEPVRREKFLELVQRRFDRWIERNELPEGLTEETWQRVRSMQPADFLSTVMRLRETHPEFGNFPVRGAGTRAGLRRLQGTMRLTPREWLEFAELPTTKRRDERDRLLRERAMTVLREEGLVEAEQLARLRTASDAQFFGEVRRLLGGLQSDPRPERDGDD